tara:strand:- start:86 stop:229 length:144 start_codon:yes stop_codon:yes gene_type:complete
MKIKLFVLATAFVAFLFAGCESTEPTAAPAEKAKAAPDGAGENKDKK